MDFVFFFFNSLCKDLELFVNNSVFFIFLERERRLEASINKISTKKAQNRSKIDQKLAQNQLKTDPKLAQNPNENAVLKCQLL